MGETEASYESFHLITHFGLHIEQGPILDESHAPVGTVSGIQAFRWYEIKL